MKQIIANIISDLISKGLAILAEWMNKRKVRKLEEQVSTLETKIKVLEHEKKKTQKIQDWKYRVKNKEQESLAKELNKIRNE